ncbi:hypothetical protein DFH05DRAFT_1476805 [Lentinula detonsa]|uniref:Uncharacterized protein n=1 Tax=Lentinula detonsa TaxID=2804962 RepID=A0A9W8P9N1_9AGAR|nr:hypothetical protein DFH05DRAFT_1476805 [Lentinula detonsa]
MANTALSFDVDDTSPIFTYFPFSDTLSIPDFTAGWHPLFNQTSFGGAPLEVENSTSVHITSLNNASFSLRWKGTGIQLFGYATDASYTILLDGSPRTTNSSDTILASIQNLDNVNHEVSLTTIISDSTQNQTSSFIVFDKATILAPASDNTTIGSNFTSQSLNDNTISFLGEWSFQNNSASGLGAVHISDNLNDNASAEFNGTALQIFGTVSPEGGNYTVKLDNVTTQFSANTSFTQNNTLLFFASALDPSIGHDIQITNNGGTLILPYNGFVAFSSASPSSPSTGTTPSPSATSPGGNLSTGSLPKGTIAALVLAGILVFLLSSGLLFFFFVWRPIMISHRQARRDRYMSELEQDATGRDAVLNIRRHTPSYMFDNSPTGSRRTRGSQKGSNRSGFLRWKREMESTNGEKVLGALGLVFRHSYSPKDKEPSYVGDDDLYKDGSGSQKSSNRSSAGSAHRGKGKGKTRWTGKSKQDAPSYTIDLPPLNRSQENFEQEVPSLLPPPAAHTSFSGFTSLTYMSTPDTNNSRELSFNPPSNHIVTSRPQSPDYGKADSNGALLIHDEFNRQARPEETPSEVDFRSSIISTHQEPDLQVHVQEFEVESTSPTFSSRRSESRRAASMYAREMDRGSVRTNDDGLSMLGPATVRAAIRSLSPRTSELAFTNLALSEPVTLAAPGSEDDAKAPRERLISDETLRPESQGPLEDIESARRDHRRTTESGSRRSARLSVRFEGDADNDNHSSNSDDKGPGLADDKLTAAPGRLEGLKGVFRLTPQRPVTSPISEGDSNITTSFLDLSGSNSNSNSDSSQREPSLILREQGLKSRWSATTGTDKSYNLRQESSDSQNSGGSASSPSSNFPFPVSLPASPHHPEGFKPSPPVSPSGTNLMMGLGRLNIQPHPFGIAVNPASPSDSVPISISDLRFRHSDSENDELSTDPTVGSGSHLPPHPPLPGSVPPTPTFPPPLPRVPSPTVSPSSPIAALSSPSYIVSRVFPHSRSDSTADPTSSSTGRQAAQDKSN